MPQIGIEIETNQMEELSKVLNRMGYSVSDALHMFVDRIITEQTLPYVDEYGDGIPNKETQEVLEKALRGEDVFHAKDFDDLVYQLEH